MDRSDCSDFMKTSLKLELKSISEMVVSTIAALVTIADCRRDLLFVGIIKSLFTSVVAALQIYWNKRMSNTRRRFKSHRTCLEC